MSKFNLNLNDREWGEFSISQLFSVTIGKTIDGNKVDKNSGQYAYITRKETNNGLDGFITEDINLLYKQYPTITIGNETAKPYVQMFPFFTGTKVNILLPKTTTSKLSLFFIARSLEMHKEKYSYSFTINSTRLKKQVIKLPITQSGEPDYAFMENFIKERMYHKLKQYNDYLDKQIAQFAFSGSLKEKQWGEFFIKDIFITEKSGKQIPTGAYVPKEFLKTGNTPRVTVTAQNNGVDNFWNTNHKNYRTHNNFISVSFLGDAFFHQYNASIDMKVHSLILKDRELSPDLATFLITQIKKNIANSCYGNQLSSTDLPHKKILLPITPNGEPDYAFMENYTRNLMLKKYKKYAQLRLQEYA